MEKLTAEELLTKDLRGKIVCFPTDTVYGVGALIDDKKAISKIYEMKKRDAHKPLAILTSTKSIEQYVKYVSLEAKKLMAEKWPGGLTLIFEKSEHIDPLITQGFNTIAFRMPNSKVALTILKHFGLMATTSVNISGEKPLTTLEEIEEKFADYLDYLVIDKEVATNTPSTVIDVTTDEIKIIRK
jgi:L-threonylcarbamoyladenylate synthase